MTRRRRQIGFAAQGPRRERSQPWGQFPGLGSQANHRERAKLTERPDRRAVTALSCRAWAQGGRVGRALDMTSQDVTTSQPWAGLERFRLGRAPRRQILGTMALAAVLAAGVWFGLAQATSYTRLVQAVGRADAWWLVLALAGMGLSYVGYALTYQVFGGVDRGPRPNLRITLRLSVAVFGASVLATSAGRLGSEYWSLRRMGERPSGAWSRVLALNTAAWAVLGVLASLAAVALLLTPGAAAPLGVKLAWLLALPVCTVPALYLSSPARRRWAEARGGRVRQLAASVVRSLVLLRLAAGRRKLLARTVIGGALYWGGELLICWAALRAFGVTVGPAALVIGYATGYVSTMLPLPAGGAGGVDAASIYAWTLVGVPLGPALLATLIQRLFSYWLPITIAAVNLRSIRRLGHDLQRVSGPGEPELAPAGIC